TIDLDELVPGVCLLGKALELESRIDQGRLGLDRKRLRLEGVIHRAQATGSGGSNLSLQLDRALGVIAGSGQDLERLDQLAPLLALLVDCLQDGGSFAGENARFQHSLQRQS